MLLRKYTTKINKLLSNPVLLEKLMFPQMVNKFPYFMEPNGSSQCLQQPTTCLYPEPDQSSPCPSSHFVTNFNIIMPSTLRSSEWPFCVRFPHQNRVRTSSLPATYRLSRSSHSPSFDHPDNIWWAVQIMEILAAVQCRPVPVAS